MDAKGLGLGRLLIGVIIANVAVALLPLWVDSDQRTASSRHKPKAESIEIGSFSNISGETSKDNIVTPIATETVR